MLFNVIKTVGSAVVGLGVSAAVGGLIKANVPVQKKLIGKALVWLGTAALASTAAAKCQEQFEKEVDDLKETVDDVVVTVRVKK